HPQVGQRLDLVHGFPAGPARQDRGQPHAAGQTEDAMLARPAQVRIDEQRALAQLREQDGEVGRDIAAPFAHARADDGQRRVARVVLEPAQHQLAAQRAQVFDGLGFRLARRDQLLAEAGVLRQARIPELQGQHLAHILFREQAHRDARLAERQASFLLEVQDALRAFLRQAAPVDQDHAHGPVRFGRAADVQVEPSGGQRIDLTVHAMLLWPASASRREAYGRRNGTRMAPVPGTLANIGSCVTMVRSSTERTRRLTSSVISAPATASSIPATAATNNACTAVGPVASSGSIAGASRITLVWLVRLCRRDCEALALTVSKAFCAESTSFCSKLSSPRSLFRPITRAFWAFKAASSSRSRLLLT